MEPIYLNLLRLFPFLGVAISVMLAVDSIREAIRKHQARKAAKAVLRETCDQRMVDDLIRGLDDTEGLRRAQTLIEQILASSLKAPELERVLGGLRQPSPRGRANYIKRLLPRSAYPTLRLVYTGAENELDDLLASLWALRPIPVSRSFAEAEKSKVEFYLGSESRFRTRHPARKIDFDEIVAHSESQKWPSRFPEVRVRNPDRDPPLTKVVAT